MHRRGFIGGLVAGIAGWFGVKKAKGSPQVKHGCFTITGESQKAVEMLLWFPSPATSFCSMIAELRRQVDMTTTGLLWMAPNSTGTPTQLRNIPTAWAIPYPPCENHPHGHYRICPLRDAEGNAVDVGDPSAVMGSFSTNGCPVIPAEQVIRFKKGGVREVSDVLADALAPYFPGKLDIKIHCRCGK
jgi:hypothetical protein